MRGHYLNVFCFINCSYSGVMERYHGILDGTAGTVNFILESRLPFRLALISDVQSRQNGHMVLSL